MRHYRKPLICLLVCLLLAAAGLGILRNMEKRSGEQPASSETAEEEGLTYFDGSWYRQRDDLETVLLLGLDQMEQPQSADGYRNDMQADFLLLLVIDEGQKSCQMLQLNRDTMTEIPILGVAGDEAGSFTGQLALAHTYGSGKADSCFNAAKAVSDLLYGVPVDHFVSMTMDGVARINDLAGGVTVRIEDDFSQVDPSLTEGSQICLSGSQALTYVRARGGMKDSSNLQRMRRQRTYMQALYEKVKTCVEEDENFMAEAAARLSDCMVSDYTANQLAALGNLLSACSRGEILPLEGSAKQGKEFMEFYVDEEALQQTVITLFYEAAEADQQAGS
ncbi:MAG: LCP family protein [Anaerovoracaceae bacterium]|nr:LCP family protein [Anaerovoracaceae bacterium]